MGGCAAGAAAFCLGGCIITNKAPTFEASPDGSLPLPKDLSEPGAQIKLRIPGKDDTILVWRTKDGFAAVSVTCTHRGCEVSHVKETETLDCPCHGSRFAADGSVIRGPARAALRRYSVVREGLRGAPPERA